MRLNVTFMRTLLLFFSEFIVYGLFTDGVFSCVVSSDMMIRKQFERDYKEAFVVWFEVIYRRLPGANKKTTKYLSGYKVFWSMVETGISQMRSKIAAYFPQRSVC
jgi:hypothetical protein